MVNIFETTSAAGFGTMRLPQKDGEIDIEAYKEMADMFRGYTYFDTAYFTTTENRKAPSTGRRLPLPLGLLSGRRCRSTP